METFQTEYEFQLPKGFADETGTLHRDGAMRLATAGDEILPMKDPRVQQNPSYLSVILLSRVVTRLGSLKTVTTKVIEGLFSEDFEFLQDLYQRINQKPSDTAQAACPQCGHAFAPASAAEEKS